MERLSYLAFVVTGLAGTIHGMALPLLIAEFNLGLSSAGLLLFATSLGYLVASVAFPFISKRIAPYKLLGIGFLVAALAHSLLPLMPTWFLVISFGFLARVGIGTIDVGFNTLISSLEPERAQIAVNWLHFSFGIGALSGPAILSRLLHLGFSWPAFYLSTGVLCLFCLILWYHLVRIQDIPQVQTAEKKETSIFVLFKQAHYWLLLATVFIYVSGEMALIGWIPTLLTNLGLQPANASLGISVIWLGITLGRAASTQIVKRLPPHRLLPILTGGAAVFMFSLVFARQLWLVFGLLFCTGLFFSAIFPLLLLRGAFLFPYSTAASASGLVVAGSIGAMLGPTFLGIIGETYSLQAGITVLALLLLIALFTLSKVPQGLAPSPNSGAKETDY